MKGATCGRGFTAKRATLVFLAALAMVGVMASSGAAAPGDTTLVSGAGSPATGDSTSAVTSANGRFVAFVSDADNLVAGDTNGLPDVFVRNRDRGTIERVSVSSAEAQATNGLEGSTRPSISGNEGRYVAFASDAGNLVEGDTNGKSDVFVRDQELGTTERVNVSGSEGQATGGGSGASSITVTGAYVAFESDATNLVPGDTNGNTDVFLRNRSAGTTQRMSTTASGGQATGGDSSLPAMNRAGAYVAFESSADNLVPGDTNGKSDVFVRQRVTGEIQRVSTNGSGVEGNNDSGHPSINDDGQYVAFESIADNLVAGDTNGKSDIFRVLVGERTPGAIQRFSVNVVNESLVESDGGSTHPSISADGRHVAFESDATNLVAGDANGKPDVFVGNQIGENTLVSSGSSGAGGNGASGAPSINSDGRFVAFESIATNLVAGDTNGKVDVFAHELTSDGPPPPPPETIPPTVVSVTPSDNATGVDPSTNVTATFSERMRVASINADTFTLVQLVKNPDGTISRTPVSASIAYDAETRKATLDPSADLAPGGRYEARVKPGAKDQVGNALDQDARQPGDQSKSWRFEAMDAPTPPEIALPTVTAVTPAQPRPGIHPEVPGTIKPTATFSKDMQPESINSASFVLFLQGGSSSGPLPIAGEVTYDAASRTATFDPAADLEPGIYDARVRIGVKDLAGNLLDQDPNERGNQGKIWRFFVVGQ